MWGRGGRSGTRSSLNVPRTVRVADTDLFACRSEMRTQINLHVYTQSFAVRLAWLIYAMLEWLRYAMLRICSGAMVQGFGAAMAQRCNP